MKSYVAVSVLVAFLLVHGPAWAITANDFQIDEPDLEVRQTNPANNFRGTALLTVTRGKEKFWEGQISVRRSWGAPRARNIHSWLDDHLGSSVSNLFFRFTRDLPGTHNPSSYEFGVSSINGEPIPGWVIDERIEAAFLEALVRQTRLRSSTRQQSPSWIVLFGENPVSRPISLRPFLNFSVRQDVEFVAFEVHFDPRKSNDVTLSIRINQGSKAKSVSLLSIGMGDDWNGMHNDPVIVRRDVLPPPGRWFVFDSRYESRLYEAQVLVHTENAAVCSATRDSSSAKYLVPTQRLVYLPEGFEFSPGEKNALSVFVGDEVERFLAAEFPQVDVVGSVFEGVALDDATRFSLREGCAPLVVRSSNSQRSSTGIKPAH